MVYMKCCSPLANWSQVDCILSRGGAGLLQGKVDFVFQSVMLGAQKKSKLFVSGKHCEVFQLFFTLTVLLQLFMFQQVHIKKTALQNNFLGVCMKTYVYVEDNVKWVSHYSEMNPDGVIL